MRGGLIDILHTHMIRKAEVFCLCGGCRAFYLKNADLFDPMNRGNSVQDFLITKGFTEGMIRFRHSGSILRDLRHAVDLVGFFFPIRPGDVHRRLSYSHRGVSGSLRPGFAYRCEKICADMQMPYFPGSVFFDKIDTVFFPDPVSSRLSIGAYLSDLAR